MDNALLPRLIVGCQRGDIDLHALGQGPNRFRFVDVKVLLQGCPGDSTIHNACVKKKKIKQLRQVVANGAFAGTGRTIDGDDGGP